ncbi:MAG: PQQ-binding-like beta-propeller repeat protein [Planctomycetota bacterium]
MKILVTWAIAVVMTLSSQALGDDWPQWMGPDRDNTWKETGLIEKFPEGGPKVVWETEVGIGYAGPSVAQGKVIVLDFESDSDVKIANFERRRFQGTERIICLNESDGKPVWKHEYPVEYTISYPSGPRCTPIIEGDSVYVLGSEGNLKCLNLNDGAIIWETELKKDYKTESALWGYSAHPLIDGDLLITLAGGKGSHIVALDKKTGKEVWRSLSAPEQGYSPPTIIEFAGQRQLICFRPNGVSSIDPATGKEIWSVPYEATSGSTIMSPILWGDKLYIAGYSKQSLLLQLKPDNTTPDVIWQSKGNIAVSPVNVQPFLDDENGVLYGMDQSGDMRAMKFEGPELLWKTSEPVSRRRVGSGTAFIVKQADRFWLFNETGELIIAEMTPDGYTEIDRAKVIEASNNAFNRPVVWSMPAFANKRIYIRNDDKIICLDVSN